VSEVWSLPGYEIDCLVGFGSTGEVWRAREVATGETVALKRLRAGLGPGAAQALRHEARVLEELDTPHVVRLREVLEEGDELVLVLDHAAGGSLATLLTRRGALTPGEVVTIGAALAAALAAVHARGLVHGDVTPANVLFRADGMPMLTDLGLARLAGAPPAAVDGTAEYVDPAVVRGGEPDAAADVWALAAVCHHMLAGCAPHDGATVDEVLQAAAEGARAPLGLLAGDAPRSLVEAVEAGLMPEPAGRPDAAGFARGLRRAHAPAPVRLSGGPDAAGPVPQVRPTHAVRPAPGAHATPPARGRRWWRPPRRLLVGGAAVAVLLAAASLGWASGRAAAPLPALAALDAGERPAATPSPAERPAVDPSPAPAAPDWPLLVRQLAAARADALTTGDAARLREVYTASAPLLAADRAALAQLAAAGHRPRGLRHVVHVVEVLEASDTRARLRVVDELSPYAVHDAAGEVVRQVPARGPVAQAVQLDRTAEGWRLVSVEPYR
jgi:hypothetical protein